MDIFGSLHFNEEEDKKDLKIIMQAFEDFCVGETH